MPPICFGFDSKVLFAGERPQEPEATLTALGRPFAPVAVEPHKRDGRFRGGVVGGDGDAAQTQTVVHAEEARLPRGLWGQHFRSVPDSRRRGKA